MKDNEHKITENSQLLKNQRVDDDEFNEIINRYQDELSSSQGQMDDINKKNESLIEENSKLSRKLQRLSGIEEKFMQISAERKTFDDFQLKNKELIRENKQKYMEIDSLNNSIKLLKNNLTKLQENLRSEKCKGNKLVLETATLSNKLKSKERESSELSIEKTNLKIERDELLEKLESMNLNSSNFY